MERKLSVNESVKATFESTRSSDISVKLTALKSIKSL